MKNLLFIDAGIFVIAVVAAFLKGDFTLIIEIIGYAGLIFIVIPGILMGSFVSGDRIRANYHAEDEERREKNIVSRNLFFVGLFNIAISICASCFRTP
ncbi:hypothetical protein MSLAZ_1525 [Methanosarcina lacustris Z-7289]|uniref:Integral membrane protein n=1 Tax=Methanosarcina lacustris Z-7289 TaxID=1434111 RepID=A0A0E3S3L7_9EURY|nr:DUF5316 domain-containing protein [Methanosarcina lacustris]AKB74786.1 hypothetical protein MSLAZ_1525 [Methanosarcina lacustris Z-7289]